MGIRDFIRYFQEHREKLNNGTKLTDAERSEMLGQAELMVGMASGAIKELESVLQNRRINLPEEHAIRFAQDIFLFLKEEEEKVKVVLRDKAG